MLNSPTVASEDAAPSRARTRHGLRNDLLLVLPFVLFFLLQLAHHQFWRDELNAFGIAVASPSIPALLHFVHYEGHPWLWYVLLWVVSRFTVFPVGMKVLEGIVGTAIYLVLGVRSPFSRVQRLLLFTCYYVSFEYTVFSRMYGLMLLFALLYVRQRVRQPVSPVRCALLLGLLASTDLTGLLLSFALALEFLLAFRAPRAQPPSPARRWLPAAVVYFGLVALSVLSLLPARDLGTRTGGHLFENARDRHHLMTATLDYTVVPYFPTLTANKESFWAATAETRHRSLFELCLPLVLLAYWISLRRRWTLMVLVGTTIVLEVAFAHLVYMGSTRHFGTTFVAFLLSLWVVRSSGEEISWAAYVLLALTSLAGVDAAIGSWTRPFSNAQNAVSWIEEHHLQTVPLVGSPDTSTIGIAELMHRRIYMLDCNCSDTFLLFSKRRDGYTADQLPQRFLVERRNLGAPRMIFVGVDPLTPGQSQVLQAEDFSVVPVAQFTGATAWQENYFLYSIQDRSLAASAEERNGPF